LHQADGGAKNIVQIAVTDIGHHLAINGPGQHDGADKTDHQGQIKADEYAQHQASQPARTNK
jgi:hypothetical protein